LKRGFNTILKLIIQLWLLGLFLHIFGLPAFKRFQDKKVIVVTSTRASGGTQAPAVTIAVSRNAIRSGWKKKGPISGFVQQICKEANTTETIIGCIERQTYNISEVVKSAKLGLGYHSKKVKDPWIEDFSYRYAGRTYTLNISKKLRPKSVFRNPLRIELKTGLLYDLFIHDPSFFYLTRNPDPAHPAIHKKVDPKELPYMYPITLTEELNVPDDPCIGDPDYNYRECIKESFSRMVGCRTKWDNIQLKDLPLCENHEQFRKLEWVYVKLYFQHLRDISKDAGCNKPCKYKKYRMIWDRQPMPATRTPTDGFGLLAITNYTTVETEELIYPWQSLVAEFGGCLGLFLGFSFMTIWESVVELKSFKFSLNF